MPTSTLPSPYLTLIFTLTSRCRALFGRPAAELAGLDVDAAAVLGTRTVDERAGSST